MKTRILSLSLIIVLICCTSFAQEVKKADLAGGWYPGTEAALRLEIDNYLRSAEPKDVEGDILAIIAPHAGLRFSGPVAAYGFKAVEGKAFKTAIIIGFTHRIVFDGISVYDRGVWRTPLGDVAIDEELAKEIIAQDERIYFYPAAFNAENSVELEIPFIQMTLKDAKIVPIAFGGQSYKDAEILAAALVKVLKGKRDVLLVVSTDMSHYHSYEEANLIDRHTLSVLMTMKAKDVYEKGRSGICELCGLTPTTALLLIADKLGHDKIEILKYANSGDTFGDKRRVVGYMSAIIYKDVEQKTENNPKGETRMLNDAQRKRLLQIARESLTSYVREGKKKSFTEPDTVLNKNMGAFVTLHKNGRLRGCIGNMVGSGPLYQTVAAMAIESATKDPRFPPLTSEEIGQIDIEISVLSEMERVKSADEVKIPGHGVMIRRGFRGGVYLPQVATETGWSKEEFMSSLCAHKAGLPPDAWKDPTTEIYVYTAEVFGEKER